MAATEPTETRTRTRASGGFPGGGLSWYPSFIDTGEATSSHVTWIAIAQDGRSPVITRNGGQSWSVPVEAAGVTHPHCVGLLPERLCRAGIGVRSFAQRRTRHGHELDAR